MEKEHKHKSDFYSGSSGCKFCIQDGVKLERKRILKIIKELKLSDDKDYRYSNEYIEEWMEELKGKIKQ